MVENSLQDRPLPFSEKVPQLPPRYPLAFHSEKIAVLPTLPLNRSPLISPRAGPKMSYGSPWSLGRPSITWNLVKGGWHHEGNPQDAHGFQAVAA
jgi:hypothetical protein